MALRTSTDASRTTRTVLRSPPARFWRSRLTMFSMSMMASSTTTPTAITSPARTIVLMVASRTSSTVSAPSSDNGIATALMTALRHSNRNSSRITMTRRAPRNSALVRLSMAISMNVAGRKIVLSTSTPGRPGSSCCSTSSTPSVTSSVLAHGSFSTMSINPSPSLITASPFSGWWLVSMSATSLRVTALAHHDLAELLRGEDREVVTHADPLVGGLDRATRPDQRARGVLQQPGVERVRGDGHGVLEGHALPVEPLGIHVHVEQLLALAPDRHVRHAGDAEQPGPDVPVG